MIGMDDPNSEPTWKDFLAWTIITIVIIGFVFLLMNNPYSNDPRWEAIGMIPGDASVAADAMLISQLSSRKEVNYFFDGEDGGGYLTYSNFDYVILDLSNPIHESVTNPELTRKLLADERFELIYDRHPALLFKNKNYEASE